MDRCPALYLWNQCDRMDCLLRWSEANFSRKNWHSSTARPDSGPRVTAPNHPSNRSPKLARHYDPLLLFASVYRPILVATARGAHSTRSEEHTSELQSHV